MCHIWDTRSQDLQSLVTCLDYRDIVIQYAVKLGCWRLHDALKCTLEAIFTVMVNTNSNLGAADQYSKGLLLTLGQGWQSWPATSTSTTHAEPSSKGVSVVTRVSAGSPKYHVHGTRLLHRTCWNCCMKLCTGHTDDTHLLHAFMCLVINTKRW